MEPVIVSVAQSRSLEHLLRSAPATQSVVVPVTQFPVPAGVEHQLKSLDPEQFHKLVVLFDKLKKEPALKGIQPLAVVGAPIDIWRQYTARTAQGNFVTALRCSEDLVVILDGVVALLSATGHPMAGLSATADVLGILVKTVDGVYEIIRVVWEGKV